MIAPGYVVVVLVLLVIAWVVGRASAYKPESKRFGLAEAEAAMRFVSTPDHVRPVLGVVVGILGYENRVADDVMAEASGIDGANTERQARADAHNESTAELKAKIAHLERAIRNSNDRKV